MRRLPVVALGLSLGCTPKQITEVTLSGKAFDGPVSIDGVFGSVTTATIDGATFGEANTNSDGRFAVPAPAGQPAAVIVNSEDHAPTAFLVGIGTADLTAPSGSIWGRRASVLDELRAEFSDCPDALTADSTALEGVVRLDLGQTDEGDDALPSVTTAEVQVYDSSGTVLDACYLDDDGVYSEEATVTGQTGRFAVFGAEPGLVEVYIAYDANGYTVATTFLAWLPTAGTAPFYPALVPLQ